MSEQDLDRAAERPTERPADDVIERVSVDDADFEGHRMEPARPTERPTERPAERPTE